MIRFSCLFVLAGVFQVITCQGPPGFPPGGGPPGLDDKCRGPPPGVENPEQCCELKPMYTEEEMASCGLKKFGEGDQERYRGPPDCSKPLCLLRIKGLVNENDEIDHEAVKKNLNDWAADGNFKSAVDTAIKVCLEQGQVPGPPQICEHARLLHCIGGLIFGNCPAENWQQTDNCKVLKDHMEACSPKFQ